MTTLIDLRAQRDDAQRELDAAEPARRGPLTQRVRALDKRIAAQDGEQAALDAAARRASDTAADTAEPTEAQVLGDQIASNAGGAGRAYRRADTPAETPAGVVLVGDLAVGDRFSAVGHDWIVKTPANAKGIVRCRTASGDRVMLYGRSRGTWGFGVRSRVRRG